MKRRDFLRTTLSAPTLSVLSGAKLRAQGGSYQVGETIDRHTAVIDAERKPVRLIDLADRDTRLLLLIFIGSGFAGGAERRLGLWCEDSADDMPLQRALFLTYSTRGARFVPIVCPPVYSETLYGFEEGTFLGKPDDDPNFQAAVATVISKTEELRDKNYLPFAELYYDPRFVLLRNQTLALSYRPLPLRAPSFGRFKWSQDTRKYGTPTIWILDGSGKVPSEPFWGNEYDTTPAHIRYTYRDVERRLDELLK